MLSNTLITNEIKNSVGAEVEFQRLSTDQRSTEFAVINETPNLAHRLKISHQETGAGFSRRRRSMVRFDQVVTSGVDSTKNVTVSAYLVLDAPVGALTTSTKMADVLAEVMSFCASTGADTTIKYDCTGNGAAALLSGGL